MSSGTAANDKNKLSVKKIGGRNGVYLCKEIKPGIDEVIAELTEPEAIELICNLVKEFQQNPANVEVIWFSHGCNKAEALRNHAAALEASGADLTVRANENVFPFLRPENNKH